AKVQVEVATRDAAEHVVQFGSVGDVGLSQVAVAEPGRRVLHRQGAVVRTVPRAVDRLGPRPRRRGQAHGRYRRSSRTHRSLLMRTSHARRGREGRNSIRLVWVSLSTPLRPLAYPDSRTLQALPANWPACQTPKPAALPSSLTRRPLSENPDAPPPLPVARDT